MQELIHPSEGREIAERVERRDYYASSAEALPPLADLERELNQIRNEMQQKEMLERRSPLSDTWLRHRRGQTAKEIVCRMSRG